jgi:rubrerythrin
MTTPVDRTARALVEAIKAEIEGGNFYLMAARSTEDPQGRQVFEQLAREEEHHAQFLRAQHAAVLATGKADPQIVLGQPGVLSASSPIFSSALRARAREAHFEMTALSVGTQLEAAAMAFYRREAEQSTDLGLRDLFARLAQWEAGHYHALLQQQTELRDDYWAGAGFAPY